MSVFLRAHKMLQEAGAVGVGRSLAPGVIDPDTRRWRMSRDVASEMILEGGWKDGPPDDQRIRLFSIRVYIDDSLPPDSMILGPMGSAQTGWRYLDTVINMGPDTPEEVARVRVAVGSALGLNPLRLAIALESVTAMTGDDAERWAPVIAAEYARLSGLAKDDDWDPRKTSRTP